MAIISDNMYLLLSLLMLGSRLWDQILYVCACRCPYHYVKTLTTYFGKEPACQLFLVLTSLLIDRQGTTLGSDFVWCFLYNHYVWT